MVVQRRVRGLLHCRSHSARQRSIKIQILDGSAIVTALPEQVGKVLRGNVAFLLDLGDLLLASAEILDVLRKTGLQVASRHAQHAANLGRDSIGI